MKSKLQKLVNLGGIMATQASIDGVKANGSKWKQAITLHIKDIENRIDYVTDCVERIKFVDCTAKAIVKLLESLESGTHTDDLSGWIEEFKDRFIYPDGYEIQEDEDEFEYINGEFIYSLNGLFDICDYHRILVKCV